MSPRASSASIADLHVAAPRQKRKASREIIDSLRHSIATGQLATGQRLPPEGELAAHFGVSQPTVREGMRVLEEMGLIEVRHGSGAYVTGDPRQFIAASLHTLLEIDRVGIIDVAEMRMAIGSYSAARIVRFGTDEELDVIEEELQRHEEATKVSDFHAIADTAIAFQASMSAAAHNPLLFAVETVLSDLLVRVQIDAFSRHSKAFWRKWSTQFADDRRQLLAAFRARDEALAVAAMEQWLGRQRERFLADKTLAKARLSDPGLVHMIRPDLPR